MQRKYGLIKNKQIFLSFPKKARFGVLYSVVGAGKQAYVGSNPGLGPQFSIFAKIDETKRSRL